MSHKGRPFGHPYFITILILLLPVPLLQFRLLTVPAENLVPHSASVMSSTRRTDTPAKYISIIAYSTELS
ncbi:Uncharacterized [Syntrophomonas zehnderi OL-4]|uniref:Uncharacterized n=1 Tax=Syntrophomonas zehnderi OL-4 TaxID=690567 RepID=A0A0E4GCE2_9FIRM|nr:Uncharacterized [Syntrophomonas zehnderi OL-4]